VGGWQLSAAAKDYLTAGLSVIALNGKQPNSRIHRSGLRQAMKGVPDSYDDELLLGRAFHDVMTSGVGIVIEPPYVVLDIDGEEGAQQLLEMGVAPADLVGTPAARTSRGLHVWFGIAGAPQSTVKLGAKLDLKGVGGYVAAPPSLHPTGFLYEWLQPLVVDGVKARVMELPEGLQIVLKNREALAAQYAALPASTQPGSLVALVRHVRHLEEGNRNNGLHWAASKAAEGGFPYAEAMPRLLEAALYAQLDRREAMTTIRSAYRRAS
jgi:hypothetical protein